MKVELQRPRWNFRQSDQGLSVWRKLDISLRQRAVVRFVREGVEPLPSFRQLSRAGYPLRPQLETLKQELIADQEIGPELKAILLKVIDDVLCDSKKTWNTSLRTLRWEPTNHPAAIRLTVLLLSHPNTQLHTYALGYLGKALGRLYKLGRTTECRELLDKVLFPYIEERIIPTGAFYLNFEAIKVLMGDIDANSHFLKEKRQAPSYLFMAETMAKIVEIASRSPWVFLKRKAVDGLMTMFNRAGSDQEKALVMRQLESLVDPAMKEQRQILREAAAANQQTAPIYQADPQLMAELSREARMTVVEAGAALPGTAGSYRMLQAAGATMTGVSQGGLAISPTGEVVMVKTVGKRPLSPVINVGVVVEYLAYELGRVMGVPIPLVRVEPSSNRLASRLVGLGWQPGLLSLSNEAALAWIEAFKKSEIINLRDIPADRSELSAFTSRYRAGTTFEEADPAGFSSQAQRLFSNHQVLDTTRLINWLLGNDDATIAGYADFLAVKANDSRYQLFPIDFGASFRCLDPERDLQDPFQRPLNFWQQIGTFSSNLRLALSNPFFAANVRGALTNFAQLDPELLKAMVAQFSDYLQPEQVATIQHILMEGQMIVRENLPC